MEQNNQSSVIPENVRKYNIGASNYSQFPPNYQPWDLWRIYHLNPFDADILKRLLRTKCEPGKTELESRREDYEKIIHVCQECLAQIDMNIYERYYGKPESNLKESDNR